MKLTNTLDLQKNTLKAARIENLSTAPSSPAVGQLYFDTDDSLLYYYDGSMWVAASGGGGGGAIDGSGSTGQVALWSDSDTVTGSADYTWNDTSKTLKIRNTASDAALTIDGASGHESDLNFASNGAIKWQFFRGSADDFGIYDAVNAIISYGIDPSSKTTSIHNVGGIGYTLKLSNIGKANRRAKIANTNSAGTTEEERIASSGTAANGFGGARSWLIQDAGGDFPTACELEVSLADATNGATKGQFVFYCYDTTYREALRLKADGARANVGLLGSSDFAGGSGVVAIKDATTAPSGTPSGGHVYYSTAGMPAWKTDAGAVLVLAPGMAGNPDSIGVAGTAFSREFEAGDTAPTWNSAPSATNVGTTVASHIYMESNDGTERRGLYSWSPGSGAVDVRMKIAGISTDDFGNGGALGLLLTSTGDSERVLIEFEFNAGQFFITSYTYASGSYTARGSTYALTGQNAGYLRISRDGSNNVTFWTSNNGIAWQHLVTQSFTFTIANVGFRFTGHATGITRVFVDWLRGS